MDSARSSLISVAATLCLILVHSTTPAYSDDTEHPTAYEILQNFGFPIGLLPQGVKGYQLNQTTGKFSTYFNDTCSFSEGLYKLKYEPTVRGYISNGKMTSLEGVSVKFFHVWMNIVEILRRGNDIDFSVGVGKAAFPVEYFVDSPQCGCGLNCITRRQQASRKLMANP